MPLPVLIGDPVTDFLALLRKSNPTLSLIEEQHIGLTDIYVVSGNKVRIQVSLVGNGFTGTQASVVYDKLDLRRFINQFGSKFRAIRINAYLPPDRKILRMSAVIDRLNALFGLDLTTGGTKPDLYDTFIDTSVNGNPTLYYVPFYVTKPHPENLTGSLRLAPPTAYIYFNITDSAQGSQFDFSAVAGSVISGRTVFPNVSQYQSKVPVARFRSMLYNVDTGAGIIRTSFLSWGFTISPVSGGYKWQVTPESLVEINALIYNYGVPPLKELYWLVPGNTAAAFLNALPELTVNMSDEYVNKSFTKVLRIPKAFIPWVDGMIEEDLFLHTNAL